MRKPDSENLRKLQAAASRRKILMTAMRCFGEKGYEGASVRDIVYAAGYSVNAISAYFGGKEGLAETIVFELKKAIVQPVAHKAEHITSDYTWRAAVKSFVSEVIALFNAKEVPNCYFAALYRHEQANLHAKKVTLHNEIMRPLFHQLEELMALGIADRDPLSTRLWTLALWNNVLIYALKHPDVIAEDIPEGIPPELFRATTIDFMVDKCIRELKFTAQGAE